MDVQVASAMATAAKAILLIFRLYVPGFFFLSGSFACSSCFLLVSDDIKNLLDDYAKRGQRGIRELIPYTLPYAGIIRVK